MENRARARADASGSAMKRREKSERRRRERDKAIAIFFVLPRPVPAATFCRIMLISRGGHRTLQFRIARVPTARCDQRARNHYA